MPKKTDLDVKASIAILLTAIRNRNKKLLDEELRLLVNHIDQPEKIKAILCSNSFYMKNFLIHVLFEDDFFIDSLPMFIGIIRSCLSQDELIKYLSILTPDTQGNALLIAAQAGNRRAVDQFLKMIKLIEGDDVIEKFKFSVLSQLGHGVLSTLAYSLYVDSRRIKSSIMTTTILESIATLTEANQTIVFKQLAIPNNKSKWKNHLIKLLFEQIVKLDNAEEIINAISEKRLTAHYNEYKKQNTPPLELKKSSENPQSFWNRLIKKVPPMVKKLEIVDIGDLNLDDEEYIGDKHL